MKASDLQYGSYYQIKGYKGAYKYTGQRKDKPFKSAIHEAYMHVFVDDNKAEVLKSSCHGVTPIEFANSVPVKQKVASALPHVEDYDSILSRAEMFATFLATVGMKPGVTDVDIDGYIVPTIYIQPNDFSKLQSLIQSIYLNKLENK